MTSNSFETVTVEIPKNVFERAAKKVSEHYKHETGRTYPDWAIQNAIQNVFEERIDMLADDIDDLVTSPVSDESYLFKRYLEDAMESVQVFEASPETQAVERARTVRQDVFTGFRAYSADRLAAMAQYIASKGREIYKTKLNKLLFYGDFIHYYLHGQSISGSRYVHLPFGPVPEEYENVLSGAAESNRIKLVQAGTDAVLVKADDGPVEELFDDEKKTLDWVLSNYGELSSSAISEMSHREKAYKFTRQGEDIAYAYAKFFEKLP
jgi:uncharacterized phage-associated protein